MNVVATFMLHVFRYDFNHLINTTLPQLTRDPIRNVQKCPWVNILDGHCIVKTTQGLPFSHFKRHIHILYIIMPYFESTNISLQKMANQKSTFFGAKKNKKNFISKKANFEYIFCA